MNISTVAALGTAFAWTATSVAFEYAAKRIGSLALNLLRLVVAFVFLATYCLVARGSVVPLDVPIGAWAWLLASGLIGFVLGDICLFQAYVDIGARLSLLVYATAPVFTALLGFAVFGERLSPVGVAGMALTLAGIAFVVLGKRGAQEREGSVGPEDSVGHGSSDTRTGNRGERRVRGILLALGGAIGQAGGLVLGKLGAGAGLEAMDPFAGTQIRVIAGIAGFALIIAVTGNWKGVAAGLRDAKAVASLSAGAFFGPFLGVSLSLLAVQSGNTGIASAIMSITPVLVIAPSAVLLHERVSPREIAGAVVAVGGVFLLCIA
jgi:drug/metabolite transporter (DMT)-like permease